MLESKVLTDEQKQMWKRLSEPYPRPIVFQNRYNVAMGWEAAAALTTGTQNVAIGYKAMVEDAK